MGAARTLVKGAEMTSARSRHYRVEEKEVGVEDPSGRLWPRDDEGLGDHVEADSGG